jgi:uncharacterized protein YjcR
MFSNRSAQGEGHPQAKLTELDVRGIRAAHEAGIGYKRLAALYGVSPNQVMLIVKRRNWAHVA